MNSTIAIVTTVINKELHQKSSLLFPTIGVQYVIDGTNKMHGIDSVFYMMKKLKGKGIDWLIMADEDVLFINEQGVYDTIDYMNANNYMVCGVRDGGQIGIRIQNPYVINTFFSILNFKELESIWNKKEILENQYLIENEFRDDLEKLHGKYDKMSLYEPYYCFYLWLRRKGKKILFLEATIPLQGDDITTLVFDINNKELAYHTWYARSYGENKKHTERIDKVIKLLDFSKVNSIEVTYFKDKFFGMRYNLKKLWVRIKMKLTVYRKMLFKSKRINN